MLRNVILSLGGVMLVTGAGFAISGSFAPAAILIVWGGILVFGIVYERYAYKTLVAKAPVGKHWVQTSERFIDEKSGKTVVVYYNTVSGERAYVAIAAAAAAD
jgi:hypothetical protein